MPSGIRQAFKTLTLTNPFDIPTTAAMGLIKTAMMSGAAMYGVKQLSNAAQQRANSAPAPPARNMQYNNQYNRRRARTRDQGYSENEYYYEEELPPRQPQRRMITEYPTEPVANFNNDYYDDALGSQQQPRKVPKYRSGQPTNFNNDTAPPQYTYEDEQQREYYPAPHSRRRGPPQQLDGPSVPAQYRYQNRQQRGFIEPEELSDYEDGPVQQPLGGSRNALVEQAMSFMQSQGSGGNGKRSTVQEFVGGFLNK